MSKQSMREEAERLIRETMERKAIVVKQGNTRIETTCGKCGAPNRVSAEKGATRVKFACKECGHKQETLVKATCASEVICPTGKSLISLSSPSRKNIPLWPSGKSSL